MPTVPENLPSEQKTTLDKKCLKQVHRRQRLRGNDKIVPQHRSHVSRKRKPGKKLTTAEKEYNKALAEIRIRVEHAIRRVKVFRVMGVRSTREKNTRHDIAVDW